MNEVVRQTEPQEERNWGGLQLPDKGKRRWLLGCPSPLSCFFSMSGSQMGWAGVSVPQNLPEKYYPYPLSLLIHLKLRRDSPSSKESSLTLQVGVRPPGVLRDGSYQPKESQTARSVPLYQEQGPCTELALVNVPA